MEINSELITNMFGLAMMFSVFVMAYFVSNHARVLTVGTKYEQAAVAVSDAVLIVAQTYVDELKKQGDFDLEAQEIARNKAVLYATDLMSDGLKKYIEKNYGDIDKWILNQIEVACQLNK